MADIRINSLPTTASASSSDDFLALDGATNGTRKLNAYSPTFGGNLTVSGYADLGSGGIGTPAAGHIQIGGSSSYGAAIIGRGSAYDFGLFNKNGDDVIHVATGTTNVAVSGNLTVSGTAATLDSTADGVGFRGTSGGNNRFSLIRYDTLSSGSVLLSAFGEVDLMYGATTTATSGTVGARLTTLGNFIIGSTGADGGQKLQVNGTAAIAGTATATRLIANSQWVAASAGTGALSATANAGVQLTGTGAVNDITLVNKNGDNVMVVPTGTTNATFAGTVSVSNTITTTGSNAALFFNSRTGANSNYAWYSPDGTVARLYDNTNAKTLVDFAANTGDATFAGKVTVGTDVAFPAGGYGLLFGSTRIVEVVSDGINIVGSRIRISTDSTPASASATGTKGDIKWDASYIYVCTATNTWKRVAIATW